MAGSHSKRGQHRLWGVNRLGVKWFERLPKLRRSSIPSKVKPYPSDGRLDQILSVYVDSDESACVVHPLPMTDFHVSTVIEVGLILAPEGQAG